ncbi:methyltransferase domain-containing protein [Bacillus sp. Bva_UNVM-123]|uniref:methyltransferase domain-containing protein n=1 Tax=Bacillus sp. Bva_UNVM-123 TaxID=2829798 RepID=UPI00391F1131
MNSSTIYECFYEDVYEYIFFQVKDADIAEDLTHETYLEAFEKGMNLHFIKKEKLIGRLLAIAQSLCNKYLEKQTDSPSFDEAMSNTKWPYFQDERLEEEELFQFISRIIKKMKHEYQQAIILHIFKKIPYKECAEILNISIEAFTSRLKRAKQAFIHQLIRELYPEYKKGQLEEDEIKILMKWFHLLDKPKDLSEAISRISANFFNGMHDYYKTFRLDTYPYGLDEFLLTRIPLKPHYICADFGCGNGHLSIKLSSKVRKVYAIDNSSEMIYSLSNIVEDRNYNNIQPIFANVNDLTELKEDIDIGYCNMLLHHIFEPEKAIREMANALKQNGQLIIGDLHRTKDNWLYKEMHDFWSGFEIKQLQEWFEKANLETLCLEKSNEYIFNFRDTKKPHKRISVPLIFAHCIKR